MKQKNKIRLLLVAVLAGLSVMGYAQGKWCLGSTSPYQIVQVTAPSDQGATFQWKKDGEVVSGETSANLAISATTLEAMSAGKYTYIRYAKKPDCPDEVASNAFTVEVLTCGDIEAGDQIGTKGTFQDQRDNKVYKIVKMPDGKVWMAENLNYQAGLTFNARADQAKGEAFTSTANGVPAIGSFWCPQLSGTAGSVTTSQNTCNVYGALYTWETAISADGKAATWDESTVSGNYVANGTPLSDDVAERNNAQDGGRGICPNGWRLPTSFDWANMLDIVEGTTNYTEISSGGQYGLNAGNHVKSSSTYLGADPGDGSWGQTTEISDNATGFSAIPSGLRNAEGELFSSRGTNGSFWSASTTDSSTAPRFEFNKTMGGIWLGLSRRSYGVSVRCVRY
jgi:uncharacterized protein (TIGR02145 family)